MAVLHQAAGIWIKGDRSQFDAGNCPQDVMGERFKRKQKGFRLAFV